MFAMSRKIESVAFVLLCGCIFSEGVTPVYVDHGNPYHSPGPLAVGQGKLEKGEGGSVLPTYVFYPQTPGNYAAVLFVPGMDGLISSQSYTEFLTQLASHGFVVSAPDYMNSYDALPLTSPLRLQFITEAYEAQLKWLQTNLNPWLAKQSSGVEVDWDFLALSSHSAGADCIHKMAANMSGNPKAVVLHGPFSATFRTPISQSLPLLMVGTEFATHHWAIFPPCVIPGWDIYHFWKMWTPPPKIMMVIKGFGHCDIINTDTAKQCDQYHFCLSGNNTNPAVFQHFAAGITSAFLADYMLAFPQAARYVLNNSTMPVSVMEMKTDLSGDGHT